MISELGVAHCDVARHTFAETKSTKNSHCAREFFFAVLALLLDSCKLRWRKLRDGFWRELDAVDYFFSICLVLDDCHDFRLRQGEQGCVDELLRKQVERAIKFGN